MTFLTVALVVCLYAYFVQLKNGLGVTGMRDFISWGMYISNFVFFIATSLVGLLISSILGLSGQKWITPISRIAEILAVAFAIVAGLVIVSDMGRPDRVLHLLFYGRLQSPIIWDITVVITYVVMSVLLLYLPLIPDTYALKNYKTFPKWQQKLYKFLSAGWSGRPEQIAIVKKSIRILLILIIPVGLAIHTVTSWLFATTSRVGWDSTIFGPYFVAGAFVAGVGAVIVAMYFFRINYKLKEYLTDLHFDKMGKLLVLVMFVYIYFNINEFLVPGFKLKSDDAVHLKELFTGHWSTLFWFAIIPCMIIPTILMFFY
jgi:molybdopterin-containing oxidoreductase family membrane subunit